MQACSAGILYKEDKVLLGKRRPGIKFYPDVWDAIGGHCEKDEAPEQTLAREFEEELGIIPTSFRRIAVLDEPKPEVNGYYEYNIFLVTDWRGIPTNLVPDEHSEIAWFGIDEAIELNLVLPAFRELLKSIPVKERGL